MPFQEESRPGRIEWGPLPPALFLSQTPLPCKEPPFPSSRTRVLPLFSIMRDEVLETPPPKPPPENHHPPPPPPHNTTPPTPPNPSDYFSAVSSPFFFHGDHGFRQRQPPFSSAPMRASLRHHPAYSFPFTSLNETPRKRKAIFPQLWLLRVLFPPYPPPLVLVQMVSPTVRR